MTNLKQRCNPYENYVFTNMEVLLCTRNAFISVFYRSESCKRMHNSELFKENYVWSNEYKGPCRELVYTPLSH